MMNRHRFVGIKQHGVQDCGAACLLSIFNQYGIDMSMEKMKRELKIDSGGTTIYGIVQVAEKHGLQADAMSGTFEELMQEVDSGKIRLPIITHIITKENMEHFVILIGVTKNQVILFDPAFGKRKQEVGEFLTCWTGHIIQFDAKVMKTKKRQNYKNRAMFRILYLFRKWIWGLLGLSLLLSFISIVCARGYQYIMDTWIAQTGKNNLQNIAIQAFRHPVNIFILLLILYVIREFMIYIRQYVTNLYAYRISKQVGKLFYDKIYTLPHYFYKNEKVGNIMAKMQDLEYTYRFYSEDIVTSSVNVCMILVGAIALWNINGVLFGVTTLMVILYCGVVLFFSPKLKQVSENKVKTYSDLMSEWKEGLDTIETIKSYHLERKKTADIYQKNKCYIQAEKRGQDVSNVLELYTGLIQSVGMLIHLWFGMCMIQNGILTLGAFLAYESLMGYFTEPLKYMVTWQIEFRRWLISLRRIEDIIESQTENDLYPVQEMELQGYDIKFKKVDFAYGYRENLLNQVDFEIKEGEKVALVGKSGEGKTTIMELLTGNYVPDSGYVYIDHKDIRYVEKEILRNFVVYNSQMVKLFSGTLEENLLLDTDIKREKLIRVLQGCQILKSEENLEEILNRQITEEGNNLSGGQKQKIAIARTILRGPNVYIWDESTNQLDYETEQNVLDFILDECRMATCIFVSHNKEIWNRCNRILYLHNGRIEEDRHEQ